MGRDHSELCEKCGVWFGGLNDTTCSCLAPHRVVKSLYRTGRVSRRRARKVAKELREEMDREDVARATRKM